MTVERVLKGIAVRLRSMSAPVSPVGMVPPARTMSTALCANADQVIMESCVNVTSLNVQRGETIVLLHHSLKACCDVYDLL